MRPGCACAVILCTAIPARADLTVTVPAMQDAFVRQQDPASNFGAAGLLCAAGTSSVNGQGQPRGRFDSVIEFDPAAATAEFDYTFGAGNWRITGVTLTVYQVAAPENAFFPRGAGTLAVAWLTDHSWTEGTGTPNSPVMGTGNLITWQLLQTILGTSTKHPLGTFSVNSVDGTCQFVLSLDAGLLADLGSGNSFDLHLSPASAGLGFTCHSRNFSDPDLQPILEVTADLPLIADVNCDGNLNSQDVAAFLLALLKPDQYSLAYPNCDIQRADLNADGRVDGLDIAPFASALLAAQGGGP